MPDGNRTYWRIRIYPISQTHPMGDTGKRPTVMASSRILATDNYVKQARR